jgi:arsenite methyltransferase
VADLSNSEVRERVRERYAAAARQSDGCGCGPGDCRQDASPEGPSSDEVFGSTLYAGVESEIAESGILSLGCGVPTQVANLHPGEVVVDLGSGGGADAIISARRVGPSGMVIGVDMTDEMLDLARKHVAEAGLANVRFVKGYIEELPLPSASVDVLISNCVINLAADKPQVLAEAARVLRPRGRLVISDVIADEELGDAARADMQSWTGCIAGALTTEEFTWALHAAGFVDVEIQETHRVHASAGAAIVRARRAAAVACCNPDVHEVCCETAAKPECCGSESEAPAACGCQ